jgi:hypothetical protein
MLETNRAYEAGTGSRYAGSGGRGSWSSHIYRQNTAYGTSGGSAYTRGTDFEHYEWSTASAPSRKQNIAVVLGLILFASVGCCIHFYRIRMNQKIFTNAADERSREVNQIYRRVKKEASERTVQEQLDHLKEKHEAGLRKLNSKRKQT